VADPDAFAALVSAIFTRRRKMLVNALSAYRPMDAPAARELLRRAEITETRRPETLDTHELVRLSDLLGANAQPGSSR
jgi:16S rRNA A1518/A1519 N6-dimethyltransferase RsmA/KsgA/DIM1 with predicted DNA glycosylase/AP lyase activity